jgi:hypothetical protein
VVLLSFAFIALNGKCYVLYPHLVASNFSYHICKTFEKESDLADPIDQYLYPDDNNKSLYHHNRTILAHACEIRMNVINAITRTNKAKQYLALVCGV